MTDFRTPRGHSRVDWPFMTRFENGTTPSYPLRPAVFLPVWAVDRLANDPYVLPPGTFVGRLNDADHSGLDASFLTGGPLVPACPVAYTVTYGANDLTDAVDTGIWTPDLDADASTAVTAAGASSTTVAAVKPLGIIARPYYAGYLSSRYENYDPYMYQTWISGLHIVRIPVMTAAEAAVEAGDLVKLSDNASPDWDPGSLSASTSTPGRVHAWDSGALADVEYVVGRCVNKVLLGKQSSITAGQSLRTAIGTAAPRTLTNLDTTETYLWPSSEPYKINSKTEGVPGLGLSATSATMGRSAEELWAYPDASGIYYALDILLRV